MNDNGALGAERTASRVIGITVAVAALVVMALGGVLRPSRMAGFFDATSPGMMPAAVLTILILCGLLMVIRPDRHGSDGATLRSLGAKLGVLVYLLAYTVLLPLIGWLLASLGLLLTMPLLAGYRRPAGIALTAILVLGSVWLIFVKGIDAPLP